MRYLSRSAKLQAKQNPAVQMTAGASHRMTRRRAAVLSAIEGLEQRRFLAVTVGVTALDDSATEAGLTTGKFRLTRDDTTAALDVDFTVTGTATSGTDYTALAATASFAIGAATADLTVTPKDDQTYEGAETVILTLDASADYTVDATDDSATVTLADNEKPTVSITAADATADEHDTTVTTGKFTVSRTGPTDGDLVVKLSFAGTGTNGTDYNTIAATVTIPDGDASVDVTVTPKDDSSLEGPETVKVTIAADATAYVVASGASSNATVTIADDELPTVKVVAADATALEGSTTDLGKFTISRNGPTTEALEVKYVMSGVSVSGTDYDATTGTATIAAGKSSVDVSIKTKQDTSPEGGETAILTISTDAAYELDNAAKAATVTISDDDKPTVGIAATDANANETGTNTAGRFTVTRTGATGAALAVPVVITGTATKGTDYKTIAATVTIPVGQASATVWVKAKDDALLEGDETVILTLGAGSFLVDATAKTATVTIAEDEVPDVAITATDAAATEPGAKDKGTFTVTRNGPTTKALTVNLAVSGSATNGTDIETVAGTIVIPAGKTSATISVVAKDDTSLEGTEDVRVTISDSATYDQDPDATFAEVDIVDDDKPTLSIAATDAAAAEEGAGTGTFTITRTGSTTDELKVAFTIGGTAARVTDYATFDGSVTIPAGSATKTITVTPVDDTALENDETVILTLATGKIYLIEPTAKSATVTIDEDELPVVSIAGTDIAMSEAGDKGLLTITRTGPTTAALDVKYAVTGTATTADDYTALTGTATIPAGKTSITVPIVAVNDTTLEGPETVIVTISTDAAYTRDADKKDATVKLADNELPVITITASDASADEKDNTKTGEFTITRTGPTTDALDVLYTTTGTAVTGTDTTAALTGKVTIPASSASVKILLTGKDDDLYEADETVIASLKDSKTTYTVDGTDKVATVTLSDDDLPTVGISATKAAAKEGTKETIVLVVTRTGATKAALDVDLSRFGSAVSADFTALPETVTIPIGKAFSTVTITPANDTNYEGLEGAILSIVENEEAYVIDEDADAATITVNDNDLPMLTIEATDAAADETGNATGTFTITRPFAAADATYVTLVLTGTAKNGKDYTKLAKTIEISGGQTTAVVTVTPKTDTTVEGGETVTVALAPNAGYTIDAVKKIDTVTIADAQKSTVSVTTPDAAVAEDDSVPGRFRVWRTGRTLSAPLVVKFGLTGTAAGADYTLEDEDGADLTDSVTIPAGDAFVDIYVTPVDNAVDASDKTLILTLEADAAYTVDGTDDAGTVTIGDDD